MHSTQNKAKLAANNNADLCASIMAANGVRTERDDIAFFCSDDPLPYYPKLITLDPSATSKLNMRAKGISVIKDSFSSLDADALGLKVAFDASWIWCEANQQTIPTKWVHIENAHDLTEWHQVWRGDGSLTEQVIFPPECLEDPKLAFLARVSGRTIVAGCIANLSESVVGISNVFSKIPNDQLLYEEALSAVFTLGNDRPVVGYEHGADLEAATSTGFQAVGPLRVLVR